MRATSQYSWRGRGDDTWVLGLEHFPQAHGGSFAASNSAGGLALYSLQQLDPSPVWSVLRAHESSVSQIKKAGDQLLASASTDGLKLWDLRVLGPSPVHSFHNDKKSKFLSIGYSALAHLLAGGTELVGVDAEVHLWDLRNPGDVVRSFVDSHHDDVTHLEFHPAYAHYLMSGSTDGYVNIYNLQEADEDDALHQVINYASVHTCHFTQNNRISVLSHMETLSFFELNNTNYEDSDEPAPHDLGDVRQVWPDCEYVVDLDPVNGLISFGANSKNKLSLYPFDLQKEEIKLDQPVWFPDAHDEEVVRDLIVIPGTKVALTCGEDGNIRSWELPFAPGHVTSESFVPADEMEVEPKKKEKKDKKEKKEKKKDRKEKKEKKERKEKKEKKSKSDVRFKPY